MSAPNHSPFLPPDVEGLLERFELAWRRGTVPDLEAFLPDALPDGEPLTAPVREELLHELIKLDLEYRWRGAGRLTPGLVSSTHPTRRQGVCWLPDRLTLEDYAARFPELGPPDCLPLTLISEEYQVRQRWGDQPGRAEYLSRFASHGDSLCRLLAGVDLELALERRLTWTRSSAPSPPMPPPAPTQPPVPWLGRYRLESLLGRGSFGSVWRAWDSELGRAVAVKLPHAGRFVDTVEEERFLREARSTACLRHPGIVTVYDVGRDGHLVYMVSELVRGVSLEAWLKDARPTFAQAADLVADVAEALHYAHQQGVVHRDVKPSNILLAVGEEPPARGQPVAAPSPRVMDFGLAKREGGEALLTCEGELLGTPAYMSPEQIRDPRVVDGRSDVYSLGVVLYELLSGALPFNGVTRMVLHQVLTEEPQPLRRLNDGVPRDLETITLTCLAKDPGRRYPTAQALADDLRRFRAGEPIRARPVPWWERVLKWARRRPALAALIGVSVLAVISLLAGSLWYNAQLQAALREADHQREVAERERELAERERDRAAEGLRLAREAVDEYFTRVSESRLLNREGLQPLRKELLEAALRYYREFLRQHGHDPAVRAELAAAYLRVGWITSVIGSKDEALEASHRARELFAELAEAQPDDAGWRPQLARVYSTLGILERERGQQVEALRWCELALGLRKQLLDANPGSTRLALDWANCRHERGQVQRWTGRLDEALRDYEQARACLERLVGLTPADPDCRCALAFTLLRMGGIYEENRQVTRASGAYEQGRAVFEQLAREHPSDPEFRIGLAEACALLGSIHEVRGQRSEAFRWYEQASRLQEELLKANPSVTRCRNALATSRFALGRLHALAGRTSESRHEYDRARGLVSELVRGNASVPEFQWVQAASEQMVAQVLQQAGRPAEASRQLEAARARWEELIRAHPAVPDFQINLLRTWNHLGRLHAEAWRTAEAIRCHERACELGEKLVPAYPALVCCQRDLAISWYFLSSQQERAGQRASALRSLEQARAIQERLVEAYPEVPLFRSDLAGGSCYNLAHWYQEANRAEEARHCLERALRLEEELVRTNPDEPLFAGDLAVILLAVGNRHAQAGERKEAKDCAVRARAQLDRLASLPAAPTAARRQLGRALCTLGRLQNRLELRAEAVRSVSAARDVEEGLVRDHPDTPVFQGNLADTCFELGRLEQGLGRPDEALRSYQRYCELGEKLIVQRAFTPAQRSGLGQGWGLCGQILRQQGRLDEARRSYERAILHLRLATEQAPAVAAYRKQLGEQCGLLASLFREMGRPPEAAQSVRE
jgi:tetratricopeptide (TPR) repeat protein